MGTTARVLLVAICLLSVSLRANEASACGGCFAPPGAVQTVNAHRMVLSLSATQTTLWDQFSYSGNPSDFSWILPIHYGPDVRVELADDRFMTIMDNITAPILNPPPRPYRSCPAYCPYGYYSDASSSADARSDVIVHREEVIGPYALAIIGGVDPMAIRDWLRDNGFSVPPALTPVIDHYTALRMDYVALRLRPGVGVSRMTPMRVTVPGYQGNLPLRMIAAGVGDRVELMLVTISDARVEAMNFPNGEIQNADLVWDFDRPSVPAADFVAAYNRMNGPTGGRLWLTESSMDFDRLSLNRFAEGASFGRPPGGSFCTGGPDGGAGDASPGDANDVATADAADDIATSDAAATDVSSPDTATSDSASDARSPGCREPNPVDDMAVALLGLPSTARVTRMRASLAVAALDRDLLLQARRDNSVRDRQYEYGTVLHPPPEPPPCMPPVRCPDGRPPVAYNDAGVALYPDGARPGASAVGGCAGGARCTVGRTRSHARGVGGLAFVLFAAVGALRRARRVRRESSRNVGRPKI